jgi:hypothetical protein
MIPTSNQRSRKWLTASWRSLAALALAASAVAGGARVVAITGNLDLTSDDEIAALAHYLARF